MFYLSFIGYSRKEKLFMIKYTFYFGQTKRDYEIISQKEWFYFRQNYLNTYLTSYTILEGVGYWKEENEKTKIVVHICNKPLGNYPLLQLTEGYCSLYNQSCVLVTTENVNILTINNGE